MTQALILLIIVYIGYKSYSAYKKASQTKKVTSTKLSYKGMDRLTEQVDANEAKIEKLVESLRQISDAKEIVQQIDSLKEQNNNLHEQWHKRLMEKQAEDENG